MNRCQFSEKQRFIKRVELLSRRRPPLASAVMPIAVGLGEGGGFRAPMARAVIGGLITSRLLTVVPVAYTYFDDFGNWVRAKTRRGERAPKHAAVREPGYAGGLAPEPVAGD